MSVRTVQGGLVQQQQQQPVAKAPPTTSLFNDFNSLPTRTTSTPNSQAYIQACKGQLRTRSSTLLRVLSILATFSLSIAVFNPRALPGIFLLWFSLSFLFALLFSILGIIPITLLRKQTVSTDLPNTPTRFSLVFNLFHPSALTTISFYLISSSFFLLSYIFASRAASKDSKLDWFISVEDRKVPALNERAIYLWSLHLVGSVVAAAQHILTNRSRIEFEVAPNAKIQQRLTKAARSSYQPVFRTVLILNITFFLIYTILRGPLIKSLVINWMFVWARPYFYQILRRNESLSLSLLLRAFGSTAFTFGIWEATHICFEIYLTQAFMVSQSTRNPDSTLISGLRSSDPYYQHFAYLELSILTLLHPKRRQQIFLDIKADGARGGAWYEISRECLRVLGVEVQRAKGMGKLPDYLVEKSSANGMATRASSNSSSPPTTSTTTTKKTGSSSPVKKENVFKPTKKSFFDSFASSTSSTASSATSTSLVTSTASAITSRVPSIFQTSPATSSTVPPSATGANSIGSTVGPVGIEDKVKALVPGRFRGKVYWWLFGKRADFVVGNTVKRKKEAIWAVESLSNLICASLKEDPYGVAQRDIPKILEAFVIYLFELETLSKKLVSESAKSGREKEHGEMVEEVEKQIEPLQQALKDGARAILEEFAPYISSFRFPPRIAARLQLLVDWG